jgi:SAM-dependent methyltransferase
MRAALQRAGLWPLAGRRVLDVGCGSGRVLAGLQAWGARPADLVGVDLLPERAAAARRNYPEIDFRRANAERLDFADASFHLVLVFTVFSSILDPGMAANVAAEIRRVCAPGGGVLWYDFRYDNPRNPHVRGVGKGDAAALFPGWRLDLRSLTLLPPLARRLGRFTPRLYPALSRVPFLRTHYLGVLGKEEGRRKD